MNKRQVIILWSIAAVLAVVVAIVKFSQTDTTQPATEREAGQTLFESFPANDVSTIELTGAEATTVIKKDGQDWVVANRDNYPANARSVLEFLRTLADVEVTQGIEAGPTFAPRFGMDPDASIPEEHGVIACFKNSQGETIAEVTLGKNIEQSAQPTMMGGARTVGRYIRNHADASGFYATNEMFPSVSAEPKRWLEDDFLNIEKIQSITLSQKDNKQPAWSIHRESEEAQFQLADSQSNEVANDTATNPLKSIFAYARFEDVVPKEQIDSRIASSGTQTATLKTFEGFTYTLGITPAKNSGGQYLMSVAVAADLPTERKPENGESKEEAASKDEAFSKRLSTLKDKLAKAKRFEGRLFEVNQGTVNSLLKKREKMITQATPAKGNNPAGPAAPATGK